MPDKTRWGRLQFCSLGTRIATNGTLSPARRPARDNNSGLELLEGYIVLGLWQPKREFWLTE